jgi:hypothetical protein
MNATDKRFLANLKAGTPSVGRPALNGCDGVEGLAQKLRCIADEMENGDWTEQVAAVLITRDVEGYLTFCEWGETGNLIAEANRTKRTTA